ncbi:MAG: hypothetical protein IKS98_13080 [Lachnospiraceae bacterium]|nr:hypothetical protein [Lachnospiraceae bacterium]
MRKDIVRVVNGLSAKCPFSKWDFDLKECYEQILKNCRETGKGVRSHIYGIREGVLVIDGKNIERVAAFK